MYVGGGDTSVKQKKPPLVYSAANRTFYIKSGYSEKETLRFFDRILAGQSRTFNRVGFPFRLASDRDTRPKEVDVTFNSLEEFKEFRDGWALVAHNEEQ